MRTCDWCGMEYEDNMFKKYGRICLGCKPEDSKLCSFCNEYVPKKNFLPRGSKCLDCRIEEGEKTKECKSCGEEIPLSFYGKYKQVCRICEGG